MKEGPEMLVMVRPDLFSEGQVKFNLASTTTMITNRKAEVSPACQVPTVNQGDRKAMASKVTKIENMYHTYWFVLIVII